ncbi:GH32 C-terminal domain-containing protein [Arthrobacter oryzae]|uniref:GH32 C-terminal domain-containing protein n=1 Tax=Arthrobacter oryzae TaxID=409290 RepID=UPI0030C8E475
MVQQLCAKPIPHTAARVFAQGGQACITDLVFPAGSGSPAAFGQLSAFAEGGNVTVRKLAVTAVTAVSAQSQAVQAVTPWA